MDPAIRIKTRKRSSDTATNWSLCFLCQKASSKDVTRILGSSGLARVEHALAERKRYQDYERWEIIERLEALNLSEKIQETKMLYHKECYGTFTSSMHLGRLKKKFESGKPHAASVSTDDNALPKLRSNMETLDTNFCIFCQKCSSEKTRLVATMTVSEKVINAAKTDYVMMCRLAGVSDLVAADAKYHLKCYTQFMRKAEREKMSPEESDPRNMCMHKVAHEVSIGITKGEIYSLLDVWERYSVLLSEFKVDAGSYKVHRTRFKNKLQELLQGEIAFVPQLDAHKPQLLFPSVPAKVVVQALKETTDELEDVMCGQEGLHSNQFLGDDLENILALHHTALRIRADVKESPQSNNCASVNTEDAAALVPESLYLFLSVLLTGEPGLPDEDIDETVRRLSLSFAQDIVHAISKGKTLTPKHVGLGMTIHQATRSKTLVNLLHNAGHSISYSQIQRIDTTLAKKSLDKFTENGHFPVPSNLVEGTFLQFAADNIDIIEETLDGKGTFHATQMVAFQRGETRDQDRQPLPIGKTSTLKIPEELQQLNHAPEATARCQPRFAVNVDPEGFKADPTLTKRANTKDICWLLIRHYSTPDQSVPAWTGFNQLTVTDKHKVTSVGYLPIINAPAHERDTLWTVFHRCMQISEELNPGQSTVITLDEQLYSKAKELQWENPQFCDKIFLRLGSFHIAKNFMKAIGQHYTDSGLQEVWTESSVFGDTTAGNNLSAKSYNRTIRAHKLTLEALWIIMWPQFLEWAKDQGLPETDIERLSKQVALSLNDSEEQYSPSEVMKQLQTAVENADLLQLLEQYDKTLPPTSVYWRNYMKMVLILLKFIRAERSGDWQMHKCAFNDMLPWFAHYDHTNYTRWGTVYAADINQLEVSHPDVYQEFMDGNFVVKTTDRTFNQISTDMALEHVNKVGKVAGGLVGITRSDSARDKWCLTYNERSRLVDETSVMFGLTIEDVEYAPSANKDLGSSRIKRDREDVQKLVNQFKLFSVFSTTGPDLTCLATRDIATESIKTSILNAQVHGQEKITEFVTTRLCTREVGFHVKLKQSQSVSLKTMYIVENKKGPTQMCKTVKADKVLFQRLLVARDAGREINLKQLLYHELSPVPLSIADTAGNLRSTNKAVLGKILEEGVSVETLPATQLRTCTIIDGQALVQAIGKPTGSKTFGELSDAFSNAVFSHFNQECSRVDVVFDRYRKESIKSGTRAKRSGQSRSIRRKIDGRDVPLPVQWKQFIDLPENKSNLTEFLSEQILIKAKSTLQNYELIISGGFADETTAESSNGSDVEMLQSTHEEADTRIILHADAACQAGFQRLIISCRDTDVLVLLVHFAGKLSQEIWMRTGTAQQRRYIAVHDIQLPQTQRMNIPAYHALTGCDTVSQLVGYGKKSTWKTFQKHSSLLANLGCGTLSEATEKQVEEFICRVYLPNTNETSINDVRYRLFMKDIKDREKLPPTQGCLRQHIKRAHYQSQVWYLADNPSPDLISPIDNGWYKDSVSGKLHPELMVDDPLPQEFTDIVYCKCKNCATTRCTCRSKQLTCTGACTCIDAICHNPFTSIDDEESD